MPSSAPSSRTVHLDADDAQALQGTVRDAADAARSGRLQPDELNDVVRLLSVTTDSFERVRNRPWFRKAWALVSGERGRFTDRALRDLGAVQAAVLRLLGELLRDSGELKEDLVLTLRHLDRVESDSLDLKNYLLAFNDRHQERYRQLSREVGATRQSLATGFGLVAFALAVGAAFAAIPLLKPWWHLGAALWAAIALALAGVAVREARRSPLPVKASPAPRRVTALDPTTTRFLGLDPASQQPDEDQCVFHVGTQADDLVDYFTLSPEEQRLLFSLQYRVVSLDANRAPEPAPKRAWLRQWTAQVNGQIPRPVVSDRAEMERGLAELRRAPMPVPKAGMILLEAATFAPYFPLSEDGDAPLEADATGQRAEVRTEAPLLGVSPALLDEALGAYKDALSGIPPSRLFRKVAVAAAVAVAVALTGGLAAPFVGGLIGGAMGLSGAAAVSAGLAFLGGGAITAGGLGMAEGTAVLIGGGSILGAGMSAGILQMLGASHTLALDQLAKLEAVSNVFLIRLSDGQACVEAVVGHVRQTGQAVQDEIGQIQERQTQSDDDRARLSELRKGLPYYERAAERLEHVARKAA